MSNETTINYGQKRENLISISHKRDVEIAVINYLLFSVENCLEILPKLTYEHFTYSATRRIYHILKDMKINEIVLNLLKNKYQSIILEDELEKFDDLNMSNAMFILNGSVSNNIKLDLFELEEYANEKFEILKQDNNPRLTVEIHKLNNTIVASYIDNRLFNIHATDINEIDLDIIDTFKETINNVFGYFNKENYEIRLLLDEVTEIPNGVLLKKDIDKLEKKEKLNQWLKNNNFFSFLFFKNIDNLINFPALKLDNLKIKQLPSEIDILQNLKLLFLSDNSLITLPNEVKNLNKLTILDLCNNQFQIIPDFIYEMKTLNSIYFHGNEICEIKEDIDNLENLTQLSISKNKLNKLPNNLSKLINLEELQLEDNPLLKDISMDIFKLPNLKTLSLDDRFLPVIVQYKNLFSKINSINLEYSNYHENDESIKSLNFSITQDDWQKENEQKYQGAVYLCIDNS